MVDHFNSRNYFKNKLKNPPFGDIEISSNFNHDEKIDIKSNLRDNEIVSESKIRKFFLIVNIK